MTQFETVFNKVMSEASNKLSPWISMDMQVKSAHLFKRAKRFITQKEYFPEFVEQPIPDVSTIALEDIDEHS